MSTTAEASSLQARTILDDLIRQRQRMRETDVDASLLEANRLGIVYWQWQLARALGDERSDAAA